MDESSNRRRKEIESHRSPVTQLSPTEPLWTVDEVASYLRVSPEWVRKEARLGRLPAIKIGRGWRFEKEIVDQYITRLS